jgi:hypothetical protein
LNHQILTLEEFLEFQNLQQRTLEDLNRRKKGNSSRANFLGHPDPAHELARRAGEAVLNG